MGFLGNLFTFKNVDGSVNKPTLVGWVAGFLGVLAATPGGPDLIQGGMTALGKYAPLVIALVSFMGGAAANTAPKE